MDVHKQYTVKGKGKMGNQKQLSKLEVSSFCSQMHMMLKGGISIFESVSILLEDSSNEAEKEILNTINTEINEGKNLSDALAVSGVYPAYALKMISIGEETGTLDEVMHSLAIYYDREDAINKNLRNALTYPLVMIGMMALVIIILLTQVMPIFEQVFVQLGLEMNSFARSILTLGNTLEQYAIIFIAIILLIVAIIFYLTKTVSGKKQWLSFAYHIGFTRDIYEKLGACKVASALSIALKSGMTSEKGLEFSNELAMNPNISKKIEVCATAVQEGTDLAEALKFSNLFSGVAARMVSIAGKTGNLDQAMDDIAGRYEEEVDTKIRHLIGMIEPTLVIVLSIIVGVILLSVMLPLLSVMSSL